MLYVVLTDKEIVECYDEIDWTQGEQVLIRDYCLLNNVTGLVELAYIILYIVYTGQQGIEFKSEGRQIPIRFLDIRLKYISEYFMDELVILTESVQEPNFDYIDIETLYGKFEVFARRLASLLVLDRPGVQGYEINLVQGNLLCKEV